MKNLAMLVSVFAIAAMIALPVSSPALEKQPQIKSEVVMQVGHKVHLFHSGTADVKKEVCVNDVIPVYRELMTGGSTQTKEVGKIKVLSYVGEHYIEAEVVTGEVKPGDIAKKVSAGCLIQPVQ
jgi:hypothetical protein